MGNLASKSNNYNDLHIITYNYNFAQESLFNNNILNNFINKFNDVNNIICILSQLKFLISLYVCNLPKRPY